MTIDPADLANLRLYLCYVATMAVDKLVDDIAISGEIPTGKYVLEMELSEDALAQALEEAQQLREHRANKFMVSPEDLERMMRQQNREDQ